MTQIHTHCRLGNPMICKNRSGAVLLEVLLACALLGISLVMLSPLSNSGSRMAVLGELQMKAAIRCETVLHELIIGVKALPQNPTEFVDNPEWMWDAEASDDETGLRRVRVSVWRRGRFKDAVRVELVRLLPASWSGNEDPFGLTRVP